MASLKFGRTYRVTIDLGDGNEPIIIQPPMTIQFNVNRTLNSSLNVMKLDIFNLGKVARDTIFQEFYGSERKKTVTFEAGYNGVLTTLFKGSIYEAYSYRENTEIITSIESRSGSWEIADTVTYTTIAKETTVRDVLKFLAGQFPNLTLGGVGNYNDVFLRPVVINGSTYEYLKKYSQNDIFIDNEKIHILQRNEVLVADYPIINKDTGILQTPRRQGGFINVTTLFEPRLVIGQEVELKSDIAPIYNGRYKVNGLQHSGIISEAVGGACQTIVDLFIGAVTFSTVLEND